MDHGTLTIAFSIISAAAAIIWHASKIKTTVDIHGNAIGELKVEVTEQGERLAKLEVSRQQS